MHLRSCFLLLALWRPRTLASSTTDTAWSNVQQPLASQRDTLRGDDTVILGAGVIGLATAYQLALAHRKTANTTSKPHSRIVVIERAAHISPAASGQATGGLGDFGFASGVADLGALPRFPTGCSRNLLSQAVKSSTLASLQSIASYQTTLRVRLSRLILGVRLLLLNSLCLRFLPGSNQRAIGLCSAWLVPLTHRICTFTF